MRKNSPPFFGIDEFFRDDVRDQRENKREDEKVCPRRQQQRTPRLWWKMCVKEVVVCLRVVWERDEWGGAIQMWHKRTDKKEGKKKENWLLHFLLHGARKTEKGKVLAWRYFCTGIYLCAKDYERANVEYACSILNHDVDDTSSRTHGTRTVSRSCEYARAFSNDQLE